MSFRTPESEEAYRAYRASLPADSGCVLCDELAEIEFTHWKILKNKFPYDRIASVHDLLMPKRHSNGVDFTPEELEEFAAIKQVYVNEHYHYMLEPVQGIKTIPGHYHLHLLKSGFA